VGAYGSVLHMFNNGLIKGALFLAVGNLVLAAGTAVAADMRGMRMARPASAFLVLAGLFAITGSPPFGLFVSEFSIIDGALQQDHPWIAGITVVMLTLIFVGLARMIIGILYAPTLEPHEEATRGHERPSFVIAPAFLTAIVLMFGLYIPPSLQAALARAAVTLGGHSP
jgi:hydrogenase-4 component F